MRLDGPGLIKLTWLEWEQHTKGIPGLELSWWQHPLKHLQHWASRVFAGHTTDRSLDEFVSPDQFVPNGPPNIKALTDTEIEEIMASPMRPPRDTKWSA